MKIASEQDESKKDALLLAVHAVSTQAYGDLVLRLGLEPEDAVGLIGMAMFEEAAAMTQSHRLSREEFLTAAGLCWDAVAAVREKGAA